jgi:hypothetical protein
VRRSVVVRAAPVAPERATGRRGPRADLLCNASGAGLLWSRVKVLPYPLIGRPGLAPLNLETRTGAFPAARVRSAFSSVPRGATYARRSKSRTVREGVERKSRVVLPAWPQRCKPTLYLEEPSCQHGTGGRRPPTCRGSGETLTHPRAHRRLLVRQHERADLQGFLEPAPGLEPGTPSLRGTSEGRAGTRGHARARLSWRSDGFTALAVDERARPCPS